jgi:hypothetical protein
MIVGIMYVLILELSWGGGILERWCWMGNYDINGVKNLVRSVIRGG